jgi:hypothetical protein
LGSLSAPLQFALLAGALLFVTASGLLVEQLILPALRCLEGYSWPGFLQAVRGWMIDRQGPRYDADANRWQELEKKRGGADLSRLELMEHLDLELRLRRIPTEKELRLPSKIGNVLRASERLPAAKYGLDAVICWPRLWLLLPTVTRQELTQARARLDQFVLWWLWSVLFLIWIVWA